MAHLPGAEAHLPRAEGQRVPDWVKHAIWWQVYPLGFASAEAANEPGGGTAWPVTHRLGQLTAWLDYAINLGASGLALALVRA